MLIFNELNFVDLLEMAQSNHELGEIAADVFRRKYSDHKIRIAAGNRLTWNGNTVYEPPSSKFISINDFALVPKLMKHFGNKIRKIYLQNYSRYNYTAGSDWSNNIRFVNEYGSMSLTELGLGEISKKVWSQFTVPFHNVEKLDFEITDAPKEVHFDGMKLNEFCPNLKALRVNLISGCNDELLNCEFPNLEHFEISFSFESFSEANKLWRGKENVASMIMKNPQIRSVNANRTAPEFLKLISEQLPQLERLLFTYRDEPLHFENVKHCILYNEFSSLQNLSFSHRLESLEIDYAPELRNLYAEFFARHRNVRKLHLRQVIGTALQLGPLMEHLPNVTELIVKYRAFNFNTDDVIAFIERQSNLMKFQFPVYHIAETERQRLCKALEPNWHVKPLVGKNVRFNKIDVILIERK